MKAKIEASCMESRRAVPVLLDGGVHKKSNKKCKSGGMEENTEEMREYLGKLQELVPFMPKNKKVSKLEVISSVIDYIHELRETLGLPPCQQTCDMDLEDDDVTITPDSIEESPEESAKVSSANQTFKVSLSPNETESSSGAGASGDLSSNSSGSRLPLSSIPTPGNTEKN